MYKRRYETVTIVNPESGSEGTDKVLERMRDAIGRTEGKEVRFEDWGRRRLAFELRKQKKGHYVYLQYIGSTTTVPELERVLGITEEAMKFQTVVLEDRVVESDFDFKAAAEERTGLERSAQEAEQEDTSEPAAEAPAAEAPAAEAKPADKTEEASDA